MTGWTTKDIPYQAGRLALVTGTGGLGYETALALATAGADVVLAGRNETKGAESVGKIKAAHPNAKITFEKLDLANLADIATFSARFAAAHPSLDLLINNAGVMTPPKRQETSDGFELQFGTNHLGHFALTAHLLPLLRRGSRPRVVNVSSLAHRRAKMNFDDLQSAKSYSPSFAYGQSKLANLLFTFELQRRSDAAGWGLMSNAAHPGIARTELIANGPGAESFMARVFNLLVKPWASQSAADGALPTLFAATSPHAVGGGYYGPDRLFELKGAPKPARIANAAKDFAAAARLWKVSEDLTGVTFSA
ncbi:oxidoreductase [Methyloferula stellata]|uniref:oxidoreductase n=1 Tax=Methyloferula stellata TaxID=876270 RepID=UPI000372CA93|nr:oxidoreductase [Methyloferula stellata]